MMLAALPASLAAEDLDAQLQQASVELQPVLDQMQQLVVAGDLEQLDEQLVQRFPQATRTPVQSLILGNLLFDIDPKRSYAFHREAALALPHASQPLLEWALEQHRAGEYAGALASYDAYSKLAPDYAPVLGLSAECLMRTGTARDAALRWRQSEQAKSGSLDYLESLVCAVHKDATQHLRRAALLLRVAHGDVQAAADLIGLDSAFEQDWWNHPPERDFLTHDLPLVSRLPGPRISAAACLGRCMLLQDPSADDLRQQLTGSGLLTDPAHTLPTDALITSLLLGLAVDHEVMTREQARTWFYQELHHRATDARSRDPELWNIIAFLDEGQPHHDLVEKEGWDASNDPRFANGYLYAQPDGALTLQNPLMQQALRQFPDDSSILYLAITATAKPTVALYAQGILAEYHHFSATGLTSAIDGRPAARTLQAYFAALLPAAH